LTRASKYPSFLACLARRRNLARNPFGFQAHYDPDPFLHTDRVAIDDLAEYRARGSIAYARDAGHRARLGLGREAPCAARMNIVYALTAVVTLTLVPLIVDLLRSFAAFRRGALGRALSRAASASLVVAVGAICLIGLALFFEHVLPYHCPERGSAGWRALALSGVYLCGATIYWHMASVFVEPGRAPAQEPGQEPVAARALPPHARYCAVCRYTVLDSDHHCLFTGKCVGRFNRFHFYAFLAHLLAASTFAVLVSWPIFRRCLLRRLLGPRDAPRDPACVGVGAGQAALVPALMVFSPIAPLVVWHALLLRADLTTAHFVKRANRSGIRAAVGELLSRSRRPCENRAWQLACGNFDRADELARVDQPLGDCGEASAGGRLRPKAG
jgi:hypothetical protein